MRPADLLALACLSGAFQAAPLWAQRPAVAPSARDSLRRELIHRVAIDQQGRDSLGDAVTRHDTAFVRRLMARDSESTAWLRATVRRFGWPGAHLVGDTAAQAAFLILQHSPDTRFQAEMLPTLWAASRQGDIPPDAVAMLDDRVSAHAGRGQTYGTSFRIADGCLIPDPIADPDHVDARRARIGLPPIAEYAKMLGEMYKMPVSLTGACLRR